MAEGFEPSHGRINSAVPYQLGYATRSKDEGGRMKDENDRAFLIHPHPSSSSFRIGGDEGSRTLIIRFTRPTLCYPVELHRHLKLVDREGLKPSQEVCRTSMLSVTSPAQRNGGCGWSRTTNLSLMRRKLCRLSYTAKMRKARVRAS